MPPRWCSLLIIGCWAATLGWVGFQEWWPYLYADAAPPYVIELADEVTGQGPRVPWTIFREDRNEARRIGLATTWLSYHAADDSFLFNGEVRKLELLRGQLTTVTLHRFFSSMRVSRAGHFRGIEANGTLSYSIGPLSGDLAFGLEGTVQDGLFEPKCALLVPGVKPTIQEIAVAAVPVRPGSVLSPLQPLNSIRGLRPGQRWRQPLIDPVADAFRATLPNQLPHWTGSAGPTELLAEVLPQPQATLWNGQRHDCWVVEYHGDNTTARTFVRVRDGLVLRQEAILAGERVWLQRE